jgi:hypothetical protein
MEHDMTSTRVASIADAPVPAEGAPEQGLAAMSAPSTVLARSTTAAMGRLLRAYGEHAPLDGHLLDSARLVARDAHRHGLTAAQMIVAARTAWSGLAELRPLVPDDDVRALSSRMISHAIREFYSAPSGARADDRPTA